MDRTLLWDAFQTLEREELRACAKFVRSPFFNGKVQVVRLFDYLKVCIEQKKQPQAEDTYQAAYPESDEMNLIKLRLVTSDLLSVLEHFWLYNIRFSDVEREKIQISNVYRRKGLTKHFQIRLREARICRDAIPWRHAEYFQDQYLLEWEQFQFASAQNRYDTFNLQEINELTDQYFIAHKLRLACITLSHRTVTGKSYNFGLLDAILAQVYNCELFNIPAIGLYYHACFFLGYKDQFDEAHFFRFRSLLTTSTGLFPKEELRTLYLLALNFCIKKSNTSGDKNTWFRQTWELYREALTLDILLENGVLSRFAFNNITSVAVHLGEVDWAEQFIYKHLPQVERKFREGAGSLNLARVAYARKDYNNALMQLQSADYRDLISGMGARIIQMKIYYEMDADDLLESHLDSIKTYLHRQKATGYHRENYLELVRTMRAVLRCNFNDAVETKKLKSAIELHPTLLEKEWFLNLF